VGNLALVCTFHHKLVHEYTGFKGSSQEALAMPP
jgi:hypothetical protein